VRGASVRRHPLRQSRDFREQSSSPQREGRPRPPSLDAACAASGPSVQQGKPSERQEKMPPGGRAAYERKMRLYSCSTGGPRPPCLYVRTGGTVAVDIDPPGTQLPPSQRGRHPRSATVPPPPWERRACPAEEKGSGSALPSERRPRLPYRRHEHRFATTTSRAPEPGSVAFGKL
jgi:hypothetical protein